MILATVFALTAMVEGGIDTWGVLYLRTHLAAGVLLGAGAYCMGQAIAVSTRGGAGGRIGRIEPRWGLVMGATVAAAGLAVEAGSHQAAAAAVGLALAAGGISLCWPLVMAVASTVALASAPVRSATSGAPSGAPGGADGRFPPPPWWGPSRRPATPGGWPVRPWSAGWPTPSTSVPGSSCSRAWPRWPPPCWR